MNNFKQNVAAMFTLDIRDIFFDKNVTRMLLKKGKI